ncbi:MAG TPA: cytochrome c biogenesis protein ResB, partial [Nocardioides sp.]|nr:cytochrome c biogenesis protein ResB [Nocardioides sp.]
GSSSLLSCFVYKGNLGNSTAFTIDSSDATKVTGPGGRAFNLVLEKSIKTRSGTVLHNSVTLPDGLGTLSFDGIAEWNRLQISQQPGRLVALGGVSLALFGLMGSLFIRPRRVWVRATPTAGGTLVEIASLDRTGGGDTAAYVTALKAKLAMKERQDV